MASPTRAPAGVEPDTATPDSDSGLISDLSGVAALASDMLFDSGLPDASVGLPPHAVGPLVGVRPSASAALGAAPREKSAATTVSYPQPWGSVPLVRHSNWDSASASRLSSAPQHCLALGSDALALLEKYFPDTFAPAHPGESCPSFLVRRFPSEGIPLSEDFKAEFARAAADTHGSFREVKCQSKAHSFGEGWLGLFFSQSPLAGSCKRGPWGEPQCQEFHG